MIKAMYHHANGDHQVLEAPTKLDHLDEEILKVTKDPHSLGFYRKVATSVPEHRVFEALSNVRLSTTEHKARTSNGAVFTSLISERLGEVNEHR